MDTEHRYPDEPLMTWMPEDFDRFLQWGVEQGVSDIKLLPSQPPWVRLHGEWLRAGKRDIPALEINSLLDHLARTPSASAQVLGGTPMEFAYELQVGRGEYLRFRGNAVACRDGVATGVNVVLRTIHGAPPSVEDVDLDPEILRSAFPDHGLVLVAGVMGSGKTTTIAALLRHVLETRRRNVDTFEDPIEFDFSAIETRKGLVCQTQIPHHIHSFRDAVRAVTRKATDVVLVGESRDPETMRGMCEASEVGVAVYSTVHTRSVEETPARIINMFPHEQHAAVSSTLLTALRLIVYQRLVPRVGGGRVALRSWLAFNDDHRAELASLSPRAMIDAIRMMVETDGRSLIKDARIKHMEGIIDDRTFEFVRQSLGQRNRT